MLKLKNGIYEPKRVTIFIGNFGSGKTEVAVNFAMAFAKQLAGKKGLSIVDLDIVNPYFRCREADSSLEACGIKTIYPKGEFTWADLPIILPEITGVLANKEGLTILDVGGDDVGARVLASLEDSIDLNECDTLFVLNSSRPFTDNVNGAVKIINEVSEAGKVPVTGLVANPHLIDETTPEIIYNGIKLAEEVSAETNIPIKFVCIMEDVIPTLALNSISFPILPMKRMMLPPWRKL